jgi:hypothetical protein
MNSNTSPANAPRVAILMEYGGEMKSYPNFRKCLLFVAKMDDGNFESVYIEPRKILEGARSLDSRDRDQTRQAKHIMSSAEWSTLEVRYTRKQD